MLNERAWIQFLKKKNITETEKRQIEELLTQLAEIAYQEFRKSKTDGKCSHLHPSVDRRTGQ
jgi:hypothetical protein